jgi:hypothetical protein
VPPEQVAVALVTLVVQATAALQLPSDWHVSRLEPEHVPWPGAQTPWQAPETQVWFEQATGDPH